MIPTAIARTTYIAWPQLMLARLQYIHSPTPCMSCCHATEPLSTCTWPLRAWGEEAPPHAAHHGHTFACMQGATYWPNQVNTPMQSHTPPSAACIAHACSKRRRDMYVHACMLQIYTCIYNSLPPVYRHARPLTTCTWARVYTTCISYPSHVTCSWNT